ncbi:MAG: ribosome maturation factor RimP [Deltaproteobacteria bacterium]|nr:ribosome maturation factor RimP [Deltaproteobacteria bacterium]
MDIKSVMEKVEAVITPVISRLGYDLVDCEYAKDRGRWVLRLFIDKPDGAVSLDDCSKVSRSLEGVLDVENTVPTSYFLEVSSPGLDRPLRKAVDFEKFAGRLIRLKTLHALNNRSNYLGKLLGMKGDDIIMDVDGVEYSIPITELAKAKLEYK